MDKRARNAEDDLLRENEKLRDAVRARDEFLAVAAHELRSPMHALLLQIESALEAARRLGDNDLIQRLERVQLVVGRYVERAKMLLDISRINAGQLQLHFETVDLAQLLHEIVDSYAIEAAFHRANFDLRAPDSLEGRWDRVAIEQIASNLISNAIKYGDGQPIEVALAREADDVRLEVRDNGIGISPEDQARIFDRFEQVVTHRRRSGFGIGLWLVRTLVEAHNGSVEVESTPGQGATFRIFLPLDSSSDPGPE